jgi:uncharacterized DUF497 family protein
MLFWHNKQHLLTLRLHISLFQKRQGYFEEAQTVFFDEHAIQFFDPEHSEDEDRFLLLGTSFKSKTLVVCHYFREEETKVRIISARKADKDEQQAYWSVRK